MLVLIIQSDEYKLFRDFKRFEKLKKELLSRYKDFDEVVIYNNKIEISRLKLEDIFNN